MLHHPDEWARQVMELPYLDRRRVLWRQVRPKSPRYLYKYRAIPVCDQASLEQLRQIFVGSCLWLSSPADFNDPFDMSASLVVNGSAREIRDRLDRMGKEIGKKRKERKALSNQLAKKPVAELTEHLNALLIRNTAATGIVSLTRDPKSILMWSHYAANHTGICIQFEVARDIRALTRAVPVKYCETYPLVRWVSDFDDDIRAVLLRKHTGWKYEMEHRVILPGEARRTYAFDAEALVGVLLGCRITQDGRETVERLLSERVKAGLPRPRLYQVERCKDRYALRVVRS